MLPLSVAWGHGTKVAWIRDKNRTRVFSKSDNQILDTFQPYQKIPKFGATERGVTTHTDVPLRHKASLQQTYHKRCAQHQPEHDRMHELKLEQCARLPRPDLLKFALKVRLPGVQLEYLKFTDVHSS